MEVVLKDVSSGSEVPVRDILAEEGQFATRKSRVFRFYTELSAMIARELGDGHGLSTTTSASGNSARIRSSISCAVIAMMQASLSAQM